MEEKVQIRKFVIKGITRTAIIVLSFYLVTTTLWVHELTTWSGTLVGSTPCPNNILMKFGLQKGMDLPIADLYGKTWSVPSYWGNLAVGQIRGILFQQPNFTGIIGASYFSKDTHVSVWDVVCYPGQVWWRVSQPVKEYVGNSPSFMGWVRNSDITNVFEF